MTRRIALLMLLVATLGQAPRLAGRQNPPPRVIVDNRTTYYVEVQEWNGRAWSFVARLNPRSWRDFPNVPNGRLWRALIGQVVREHRVAYVYDQGYRGYQDVWIVQ